MTSAESFLNGKRIANAANRIAGAIVIAVLIHALIVVFLPRMLANSDQEDAVQQIQRMSEAMSGLHQ